MKMSLKAIRYNKDLSIEEASKMIGISKETLLNYESFKTFPNVLIIEKILNTYDVKYDDIIFLPKNYGLTVKRDKEN